MENADRFLAIEGLVVRVDTAPSWQLLCSKLRLPGERWRHHDPLSALSALGRAWADCAPDWTHTGVLWLGIESNETTTYLDPVGYEHLDETDFPRRSIWHAPPLPSRDLTAFSGYAREVDSYDAYGYAVPLAWTALAIRLLGPAPPGVPVLAGFGDGDYFAFK